MEKVQFLYRVTNKDLIDINLAGAVSGKACLANRSKPWIPIHSLHQYITCTTILMGKCGEKPYHTIIIHTDDCSCCLGMFREPSGILTNKDMSLKLKFKGKVYVTWVRSAMVHGSETWAVDSKNIWADTDAAMDV